MSEEKTLGQIAYEHYDDTAVWERDASVTTRARWERAAKAVALALESADRKTTKCENARPMPEGKESSFYFACITGQEISPGCNAKVRE